MKRTETQPGDLRTTGSFGPAPVLDVDERNGKIHVLIDVPDGSRQSWARWALPQDCELGCGDTVLVAGDSEDGLYVVGVLDAQARGQVRRRRLVVESGAKAEAEDERLKVFAADGALLFEHDPASGKSRIGVADGDLEIVTRNGNIDFISAGNVRFAARSAIEMKSLQGINLATADKGSKTLSALDLQPGRVDLRGAELGISARKGELSIDETEFTGGKFSGTVTSVKLAMKRCESVTETVIAKARNVYRTVEELAQLRTGRLRTLVDQTYQMKSRTAILKADEDFKVNGEKIHLG